MAKKKEITIDNFKTKVESKEVTLNNNTIQVKQYLSVIEKIRIAKDIAAICIRKENQDYYIDNNLKDIAFTFYVCSEYSNIKFSDEILECYDILKTSGLEDCIMSNIDKNEVFDIKLIVENEVDQEFIIKQKEENILENIINTIRDNIDVVNNIDEEKLQKFADAFKFNNYSG